MSVREVLEQLTVESRCTTLLKADEAVYNSKLRFSDENFIYQTLTMFIIKNNWIPSYKWHLM